MGQSRDTAVSGRWKVKHGAHEISKKKKKIIVMEKCNNSGINKGDRMRGNLRIIAFYKARDILH